MNRCMSFRKGLAGLAITVLLCSPLSLFAADGDSTLVDDCEGGSNQNKMGYYWYYYDDTKDGGNSTIDAPKDGSGSYVFTPAAAEGHPGAAAKISYTFGDTMPHNATGDSWANMVGMGTMFCKDGSTIDATGATGITFWAKADPEINVNVEIATSTVTDFNYHFMNFNLTSEWTQYTISFTDKSFKQDPTWGSGKKPGITFDVKEMQKIQWKISDPGTGGAGTVWIDNIVIQGAYVAQEDFCQTCVGAPSILTPSCKVTGFDDTEDPSRNNFGFFTYCYIDSIGRLSNDYSHIVAGASLDDPSNPVIEINGNGNGTGNGAYLNFVLGNSYASNGNTIKPFVGIGTMLQIDKKTHPTAIIKAFDASKYTGLYLEYKTDANFTSPVRIEVPAQEIAKEGAVHYIYLPPTKGEWKGAKIPFTTFKLPTWEGITQEVIDQTSLQKIQIAIQSDPSTTGEIYVDNIYFYGSSDCPQVGVNKGLVRNNTASMSLKQTPKNLTVSLALPTGVHSGIIELVSISGRVILKQDIKVVGGTNSAFNLGYSKLPSGAYILKVKTVYGQGKSFSVSERVSVIN